MENSTSINNLKDDSGVKDNSNEIDNIINQIQRDNSQVKQDGASMNEQMPQYHADNIDDTGGNSIDENVYEDSSYSTYDVIYNEVSYPLLVIVLFILLSIPQVDTLMCSYISFICSDSGDMNFFGTLLKSLLIGILFYFFGKYVV
jgi:hypothetical protein